MSSLTSLELGRTMKKKLHSMSIHSAEKLKDDGRMTSGNAANVFAVSIFYRSFEMQDTERSVFEQRENSRRLPRRVFW